jgi:hypothetical protein
LVSYDSQNKQRLVPWTARDYLLEKQ